MCAIDEEKLPAEYLTKKQILPKTEEDLNVHEIYINCKNFPLQISWGPVFDNDLINHTFIADCRASDLQRNNVKEGHNLFFLQKSNSVTLEKLNEEWEDVPAYHMDFVYILRFAICSESGFNTIVSIEAVNPTHYLQIFPNPMQSVATVQSEQPLSLIQIYNVTGTLVHEQDCHGEFQTLIYKQSLSSGMYFVKSISQTGDVGTKKLIVK